MTSSLVRRAVAQRCADRPSAPGQLPQRQRLGDVHGRCGSVAQQQPAGPRLHAVGVVRSEERSCYRQGESTLFDPNTISLYHIHASYVCVLWVCRGATTSCRLCIRLHSRLVEGSLVASISPKPTSCYRNQERLL